MVTKIRDKIIKVDISKLKEYEKNNKNHPEEQISLLVQNIDQFGFTNPLLIDENNIIIAGHGRKLAAERIGYKELPCIKITDLTENQIKALRIADNRVAALAEDNIQFIEEEFLELQESGLDYLTGWKEDDFEFAEESNEVEEDDFDYDEDKIKTNIKKGDIIKLGNHRLMCGDSTSESNVKELVNGNDMDCIWTDPPWNVNYGSQANHPSWKNRNIENDNLGDKFGEFLNNVFKNYNKVLKEGGMIYVAMSAQEWGTLMLIFDKFEFHWSSTIIWKKNSLVLSRKDYHTQYEPVWYGWKKGTRLYPLKDRTQSDVWDIDRPSRSEEHPTMKPIELVARSLNNSTDKNSSVIDLFGGSGSTLIACEQLNRVCYMMELDEKYCEVICQRWEKLTGNKREVLNGSK